MSKPPDFRRELKLLYGIYFICLLIPPLWPVLLIIALVVGLRPKAKGTIYHSHFEWLVRSFAYMVGAMVIIAMPLWGMPTHVFLLLPLLWALCRIGKGFYLLRHGRPIANPKAFI